MLTRYNTHTHTETKMIYRAREGEIRGMKAILHQPHYALVGMRVYVQYTMCVCVCVSLHTTIQTFSLVEIKRGLQRERKKRMSLERGVVGGSIKARNSSISLVHNMRASRGGFCLICIFSSSTWQTGESRESKKKKVTAPPLYVYMLYTPAVYKAVHHAISARLLPPHMLRIKKNLFYYFLFIKK